MKHTYLVGISLVFMVFILSGCLYPKSELAQNQIPYEEQLNMVQTAVDETPIFEKYLIDFSLLKERGLLASIPGNAYEMGGVYQYVLITPEEDPRVKLIDLRLTEALRSVHFKLKLYRDKHLYPPFGEEITKGVYQINYDKLAMKEPPRVVSPYSQVNLPIVMDVNGELYIDYRIDLQRALEENDHSYTEGDDIRMILAETTPFVPAYSLPYTILENGDVDYLIT